MKYLVVSMYLFLVLGAHCSEKKLEKRDKNQIQEGFFDVFNNFPQQVYEMFTNRETQHKAIIKKIIKLGFTTVGWLVSAQVYSLMFKATGRVSDYMNLGEVFSSILSPSSASLEIGAALVTTAFTMLIWFAIILLFDDNVKGSSRENDDVSLEETDDSYGFDIARFIEDFPKHLHDIFSWKSIGMTFGYDIVGFLSMQMFWVLASFLPKKIFREKREILNSSTQFGTNVYNPYKQEIVNELYNNLYEANNKYISVHDLPK